MNGPLLRFEVRDHVAHLTLNRPAKREAPSPDPVDRPADAWDVRLATDRADVIDEPPAGAQE